MTNADVQSLWLGDDGRVHIRRDIVIEPGHVQISERPTDDELRRVINYNLESYRRGLAQRNQSGGTTPMSGWKIALILLIFLPLIVAAFFALYPAETRNFLGAVWARAVSATCIPPAPYATFDGIHKSGDSKWRVPVDDCPD